DVDAHGPPVRQARHRRQGREATERPAEHAQPLGVDPVQRREVVGRSLYVPQLAAAPVAVDELLVALPVAGGAADVGRQDAYAAREQVLVEPVVGITGQLLRLGAAVYGDDDRERPLAPRP